MNSSNGTYLETSSSASVESAALSIALIGPDEQRRKEAAGALLLCDGVEVREFMDYPPSLDDVPRMLDQRNDVIIIDLDSKPEYALEMVETLCSNNSATVMVYSSKPDPDLLVRCMRAGAREFLSPPFKHSTMSEALMRASARRTATRLPSTRKTGGRLLVFLGAKGGAGVTTLACNFAVALAQESGQSTLLVDLDLPLGDAALNLGIVTEYSTVNALQDAGRLDASFLNKLLTKHSSGVSVLAAPGKFPQFHATNEAIDKLMTVARQEFDNVVVDVGARLDLTDSALFKDAFTIYLVTQAGIPELRNSNRLISQFFTVGSPKLEIVINRHEPRGLGVSDETITKALTRAANWKIPNDYAAVRQMQNTATPLALGDSPISKLIKQMAISICGQRATQPKKKGFRLFG
jgi:pilus assembly protein CpaE